ncbi:cytochrome c3 family protein [Roseofilum reptotaenium CS-1145]|uniref:Tetrahaem cytochrome domain-containing protein n=1 Tax=Roseofilum reptotaenium AO1-A TaxID=1925591 RepID=A0A1L9QM52_9CYAN|nr:cytochrome c3 family protein [Roseofilum reptotaenium]MDB9517462.1 cytochrome c3 family protein [Roseofilum reptotaenium CS-1145]OJJ20692.1 hypothetical protein BI308_20555 [Roseofilum reptotaenium AO1-A]
MTSNLQRFPLLKNILQVKTAIIAVVVLLLIWGIAAFALDQRQIFLPGVTSDGHTLIEASCSSCHEGFKPVSNETCMRCHEAELVSDIHGPKKFRDPRWAEYLSNLDVLTCTACHAEHVHMFGRGVHLKPDLCMACHEGVITGDIPSHKGFEPDGCWTAGCHNFHDHRSISTGFLRENLNQPILLPKPEMPNLEVTLTESKPPKPDLGEEFLEGRG